MGLFFIFGLFILVMIWFIAKIKNIEGNDRDDDSDNPFLQ